MENPNERSGGPGGEPGAGRARRPVPGAEPPPREPRELPNLAVRAAQVFVSPARLFERLRERPVWIGAVVLMAAIGLASVLLIPEEILRRAMVEQAASEADADAMEGMMGFIRAITYVMAVLVPLLATLVVAGALALLYNLILGGEASFRQLLGVTSHSLLIWTVGGAIAAPLILATGDPEAGFTLDLLVPGLEGNGYAGRFLGSLNVFPIWTAGVLGIGVSRVYRARSAGRAASVLILLYVAVKAVQAMLGG